MKKLTVVLAFIMALSLALPTLPIAAETQDEITIWNLHGYLRWYSPEFPYPSGGVPAGQVVIFEYNGRRALHILERGNDNHGIDIRHGAAPGMQAGDGVQEGDRIVVEGRILSLADEDTDTRIRLQRIPGNILLGYFDILPDGSFEISHTYTAADVENLNGVRVSTTGTESFVIYNTEVRRSAAAAEAIPNWDLNAQSLAEAFSSYFHLGNIWSNRGQMGDIATFDMFLHHYNSVTASNHHKVSFLLGSTPNAWQWDFNLADAIVDFAEENNLAMVGHTLVWHSQSQAWLTNVPGTTEPLTRAEAIDNMQRYISTVAARYAGRIYSWDVVNEVISPAANAWWGQNPNWRAHMRRTGQGLDNDNHSRWYDAFANGAEGDECGSDFVFYAFRFARIYDPYAILYYNDYNTFASVKREAIAQMVEQINQRWTLDPLYDGRLLIEGIGMQAHYNLRAWPARTEYVRTAVERFARTGARVSITELNVYLEGGGIVPTPENLPELFEEQARRYYELFNIFLEFQNDIHRVTSFIWVDLPAQQGAWRRWPHSQHPAWFDLERQTKPAFYATLAALENFTPNISVPQFETTSLGFGDVDTPFSVQLAAVQTNNAPLRFGITDGELPPGLRLVAATGVILGTPQQEGAFTFTATVENALGSDSIQLTLAIGQQYYESEEKEEETAATSSEPLQPPPQTEEPPHDQPDDASRPMEHNVRNTIIGVAAIAFIGGFWLSFKKAAQKAKNKK